MAWSDPCLIGRFRATLYSTPCCVLRHYYSVEEELECIRGEKLEDRMNNYYSDKCKRQQEYSEWSVVTGLFPSSSPQLLPSEAGAELLKLAGRTFVTLSQAILPRSLFTDSKCCQTKKAQSARTRTLYLQKTARKLACHQTTGALWSIRT